MSIRDMMDRIFKENSQTSPVSIEREPLKDDKIATLKKGIYKPLTPQLKEVYNYCSYWTDALAGQDILSLDTIDRAWDIDWIKEHLDLKLANYSTPPGGGADLSQISIFAANQYDLDEIYLLWKEGGEPSVVRYFGGDVRYFDDLEDLFTYYST